MPPKSDPSVIVGLIKDFKETQKLLDDALGAWRARRDPLFEELIDKRISEWREIINRLIEYGNENNLQARVCL